MNSRKNKRAATKKNKKEYDGNFKPHGAVKQKLTNPDLIQ